LPRLPPIIHKSIFKDKNAFHQVFKTLFISEIIFSLISLADQKLEIIRSVELSSIGIQSNKSCSKKLQLPNQLSLLAISNIFGDISYQITFSNHSSFINLVFFQLAHHKSKAKFLLLIEEVKSFINHISNSLAIFVASNHSQ